MSYHIDLDWKIFAKNPNDGIQNNRFESFSEFVPILLSLSALKKQIIGIEPADCFRAEAFIKNQVGRSLIQYVDTFCEAN